MTVVVFSISVFFAWNFLSHSKAIFAAEPSGYQVRKIMEKHTFTSIYSIDSFYFKIRKTCGQDRRILQQRNNAWVQSECSLICFMHPAEND